MARRRQLSRPCGSGGAPLAGGGGLHLALQPGRPLLGLQRRHERRRLLGQHVVPRRAGDRRFRAVTFETVFPGRYRAGRRTSTSRSTPTTRTRTCCSPARSASRTTMPTRSTPPTPTTRAACATPRTTPRTTCSPTATDRRSPTSATRHRPVSEPASRRPSRSPCDVGRSADVGGEQVVERLAADHEARLAIARRTRPAVA